VRQNASNLHWYAVAGYTINVTHSPAKLIQEGTYQ
jgi:hypothetical protein